MTPTQMLRQYELERTTPSQFLAKKCVRVCIKYLSERNWFELDCRFKISFLTAVIVQWKSAENKTFVNVMPNDSLVHIAIYCRPCIVY